MKCYYRAGDDQKGKWEPCIDVVKRDKNREIFLKKLQTDDDFRNVKLRWTKHTIEDYVKDYKEKGTSPGPNITGPPDHKTKENMMCSSLYLLGDQISKNDTETVVKTESGKEMTFKNAHVCAYDESHDYPPEQMPDDVTKIVAFGEAALLLTMRKRLCGALNIYTYVGDIVLCLNPYMMLPEMVDIAEYPKQKIYKMGEDPNAYATAHFAYWGSMDEDAKPRNQSCIVSGESGAGKTVACGFIMKYLAKMSNWRKQELGEWDPVKEASGKNITALVAGVSPFLEMFGNAKTNMNDNSSRFGKFTKIWFKDGKIIGAELVHYLLEKARLAGQGKGERTYHVFYGLIRGAKPEEQAKYQFKKCEEYPLLCEGGSTQIGHGHGPEYDVERFNAPLAPDPDDTGIRAALTAAEVSVEQQQVVWKCVTGVLKMLTLAFTAEGESGSVPADPALCTEIAGFLGLLHGENMGEMLCISRIELPGNTINSPVKPGNAEDNRNALAKEVYGRIFAWLINDVCNDVLMPDMKGDAFVGLLDIFGFELMPKNSIEQLCINFANEKLQQLFNQHVFDDEEKTYLDEGVPTSAIPPHEDNTPCCNLVAMKTKKFNGIFPMLDDAGQTGKMTDEKYVGIIMKKFGKKKGMNKKAKSLVQKKASKYIYGDRKKDYLIYLVHYAGDVKYDARDWLDKNKDKLPIQLSDMMAKTEEPFLKELFDPKAKKKKKKTFKTLASKYLYQLKSLATTLKATEPHYVRCVKPNDIHFTPVDGDGAFNDWKTYRQLLYAGVMEVCKIKKLGFPFRETYAYFWEKRAVKNGWCKYLGIPPETDPKEATELLAKQVLPGSHFVKDEATGKSQEFFYWTLGKTLFFSKDDTLDKLRTWHQEQLVSIIGTWWRYWVSHGRYVNFANAALKIGENWRALLTKRVYASMEKHVIRAQSELQCIKAHSDYVRRVRSVEASQVVQRNWRNYNAYTHFEATRVEVTHERAHEALTKVVEVECNKVRAKMARVVVMSKVKGKFLKRRCLVRVQAHTRAAIGLRDLRHKQNELYGLMRTRRVQAHTRAAIGLRDLRHKQNELYGLMRTRRCQAHVRLSVAHEEYKGLQLDLYRLMRTRRCQAHVHLSVAHQEYKRLQSEYWRQRHTVRIQFKVRSAIALGQLRLLQYRLAFAQKAATIASSVYSMNATRVDFVYRNKLIWALQPHLKMLTARTQFRRVKAASIAIQAAVRRWMVMMLVQRKADSVEAIQRFWRFVHMRAWYRRFLDAAAVIERFMFRVLVDVRYSHWYRDMDCSSKAGDVGKMINLLALEPPYNRLSDVPKNMLVNMRDKQQHTSFLHSAVESGSFKAVELLIMLEINSMAVDLNGETALHYSIRRGDASLRISKYIVDHCKDRRELLNYRSHDENYPCDVIVDCASPTNLTVTWLLENRAHMSPGTLQVLNAQTTAFEEKRKAKEEQLKTLGSEERKDEQDDRDWQYLKLMMPQLALTSDRKNFDIVPSASQGKNTDRVTMAHMKDVEAAAIILIQTRFRGFCVQKFYKRLNQKLKKNKNKLAHKSASVYNRNNAVSHSSIYSALVKEEGMGNYWKCTKTPTGKTYYYNSKTGHTMWTPPPVASSKVQDNNPSANNLNLSPMRRMPLPAIYAAKRAAKQLTTEAKAKAEAEKKADGAPRGSHVTDDGDGASGKQRMSQWLAADAAPPVVREEESSQNQRPQSVKIISRTPPTRADNAATRADDAGASKADNITAGETGPLARSSDQSAAAAAVKQDLLRASMALDVLAGSKGWHYIDGSRVRYGPYPDASMQSWLDAGHIHSQQLVARAEQGPYVATAEMVRGRSDGFLLRPLPELRAARDRLIALLNK